jgi:fatty-acyl-CoA synthase
LRARPRIGRQFTTLTEVEEAIYRLDGVSEVAVIGVPHPNWVEAVVAVVVRKEGAILDQGQVLDHAHKALAGFKVPKRVVFAEALPKNPSGKILKRQLREEHVGEFG